MAFDARVRYLRPRAPTSERSPPGIGLLEHAPSDGDEPAHDGHDGDALNPQRPVEIAPQFAQIGPHKGFVLRCAHRVAGSGHMSHASTPGLVCRKRLRYPNGIDHRVDSPGFLCGFLARDRGEASGRSKSLRNAIPSGTLSPGIDLEKRQIARAALQTCRPLEYADLPHVGWGVGRADARADAHRRGELIFFYGMFWMFPWSSNLSRGLMVLDRSPLAIWPSPVHRVLRLGQRPRPARRVSCRARSAAMPPARSP